MKQTILISLLIILSISLIAQHGYKIDIEVPSWSGREVYLGYYYGESTYIKDTALVDDKGKLVFEGSGTLPQGMYMTVIDKSRQFDFLIGNDQQFSLTTDTTDFVKLMKVEGDVNNQLMYSNMTYNKRMNDRTKPYLKVTKDSLASDKEKHEARVQLTALNEAVEARQNQLIKDYPNTLVAKILNSQRDIEVPNNLSKDEQFSYYRTHYWDRFDLSNDAFIRLPESMYRNKIEKYLDNLHPQVSDSIIVGIEHIISRAKPNKETYKYAVWNLCIKYQNPKYMGLDEVFVYLYDKYFVTGEMDYWANQSLKDNLKERANQLRKSLIGQKAQNMVLLDDKLQQVSLYNLKNKYTVIYFYDPDCSHCKEETPLLKKFYDNTKHDVEVFAVSADTSMLKMRNYIKDNGLTWVNANGPRTITPHYQKLYDASRTPTIYVLDERKKIIAKKIDAARLEEFLDNYSHHKRF